VQYVVGLARNSRLQAMIAAVESDMKAVFDETGMTQRRFVEFGYGARTWKTPRRCVARLA
jgi:nitric oxide synthase oxygenase domain/subunit